MNVIAKAFWSLITGHNKFSTPAWHKPEVLETSPGKLVIRADTVRDVEDMLAGYTISGSRSMVITKMHKPGMWTVTAEEWDVPRET